MAQYLLLIPGLGNTHRLFEHQIEAFSAAWDVAVADHGRDDSIEAMAGRILDEAPGTFALGGLSMGGYVAMEIMRQAPERVERLALLDTSPRPDASEARGNRQRLIGLAESARWDDILDEMWPKLVHPDHRGDAILKASFAAQLRETGAARYVRQQHAIMNRPDSRPSLPEIEIPTLVLVGEGDAITPPEIAREMAEMIEWSSLVIVPGAGHLSAMEQPSKVTEALRLWLEAD